MGKNRITRLGRLTFDRKIGTGTFRDCYSIKGRNDICIKVIRSDLGLYRRTWIRFFRKKINSEEYESYSKLPEEIKKFFNPVCDAGDDYAISPIPKDFDGTYSRSLREYKGVANEKFWDEIGFLFRYLLSNRLWFFDVFTGHNLLVVKQSADEWMPIIIDFKQSGWKAYRFQVNLLLLSQKRKKLQRQYERLIMKYRK